MSVVPFVVSAQQVEKTKEQIIAELQIKILELQMKLLVLQEAEQAQTTPAVFPAKPEICSRPVVRLTPGDTDSSMNGEVTRLQIFLSRDASVYPEKRVTGFYGDLTQAAVRRFQIKYNIVSTGDPQSTGFGAVGPRTLAIFDRFCIPSQNPAIPVIPTPVPTPTPSATNNQPPVIYDIGGPRVLRVGETGTWVVNANDPEHGTLSFIANWGESSNSGTATSSFKSSEQSVTFTHSYSGQGVYNPSFVVRDSAGMEARQQASIEVQGSLIAGGVAFSVSTDKTLYVPTEKIYITIEAKNTTEETKTLEFTSGCQASYTIYPVFELEKRLVCTQVMTSVVILPHSSKTWILTHSPEDYRLAGGAYRLGGKIIGYGEASASFTVSQGQ
jgi:peptidoglycan hydrolase-like protein with peptidoglycan-binding domain